jgi:hypothetical protein
MRAFLRAHILPLLKKILLAGRANENRWDVKKMVLIRLRNWGEKNLSEGICSGTLYFVIQHYSTYGTGMCFLSKDVASDLEFTVKTLADFLLGQFLVFFSSSCC